MLPALRNGHASLIDRMFAEPLWPVEPVVERRSTTSAYYSFVDKGSEYVLEFSLPVNADTDQITAQIDNGTLRVTVPKPQAKSIDIEVKKDSVEEGG